MLLVAVVGEHWARGAGDAVGAGADVLLLTGQPQEKELADAISVADGRPCGMVASGADADRLSRLRDAGFDFLVLDPDAPAGLVQDEQGTFLLRLREELTEAQLRALSMLGVDALYVELEPVRPTIRRQMEIQRISGLARRPLLLPVRTDAQQEDLLALRDAGVVMVAVDLKERGAADSMRRLRGVIEALPPRRRPRVTVGKEITLRPSPDEEEEEEEEEEE